jgi:hypothetical protein
VKRSQIIVTVALVGAVAAFGVHRRLQKHEPATTVTEETDEASESRPGDEHRAGERDELARMRAQVAALQAVVGAQTRTNAQPAPVPEKPEQRAEIIAKETKERRVYFKGVETAFWRETVDPNWAQETTTSLKSTFDLPGVKLDAKNIECRSRSCRVELEDASKLSDVAGFMSLQIASKLPEIAVDNVIDENGHHSAIMYLSRSEGAPAAPSRLQ